MKNKATHFPFTSALFAFALVFFAPLSMTAQNALGCNGSRYLNDIFTDTTMTTVQYGANRNNGQNQNLFMDIVQPKNDTLRLRPLVIWAFGGGFIAGKREDMRQTCQIFSRKGYVTATIDYRLYAFLGIIPDSNAITPTIVKATHDMKAAIRYFKKTVKEDGNPYRIDTSNIIVGGVSAGAITAMLTAQMDSTDPIPTWIRTIIANEGGMEGTSGTPNYRTNVKGAISMSGGMYRKEWLDKGDVPFASFHGTADNVVAYGYGLNVYNFYGDGSGTLAPRALELGIPTVLVTVPGGGHTDIYSSAYLPIWLQKATTFMHNLVCGVSPLPTEDISNQQVNIYPNPSTDDMTLELGDYTEGVKFDLMVVDALGRSVFALKNQSSRLITLRKKDIGTGLFFVRLNFSNQAKPVLKKVVFE
ncbi:MAG: carboxylesterase family protein [Saprospiraceae bacterium]|nr:carboxylesterase family protein [Saprospiraceae bacterium]